MTKVIATNIQSNGWSLKLRIFCKLCQGLNFGTKQISKGTTTSFIFDLNVPLHTAGAKSHLVIFLLFLLLDRLGFLILFIGLGIRFLPYVGCSLRSYAWFSYLILTCLTTHILDWRSRSEINTAVDITNKSSSSRILEPNSTSPTRQIPTLFGN